MSRGSRRFHIRLTAAAKQELKQLPRDLQRAAVRLIKSLSLNPRPVNARSISTDEEIFNISTTGFAVIYSIEDVEQIVLISGIHDEDFYRRYWQNRFRALLDSETEQC